MKLLLTAIFIVSSVAVCAAQETTIRVGDVISALSGYQNSTYFRAVLVQGEEDADLYIFARPDGDLKQVAYGRNIVFTGIGGTDAYLDQAENGAIELVSQNIAIGRHRWEQKLTIVYVIAPPLMGIGITELPARHFLMASSAFIPWILAVAVTEQMSA